MEPLLNERKLYKIMHAYGAPLRSNVIKLLYIRLSMPVKLKIYKRIGLWRTSISSKPCGEPKRGSHTLKN